MKKDPFEEKLREIGEVIKDKYLGITDEAQKLVFFNKYIATKTYPAIKGFAKK